jgi:hypothetical protein
LLETKQWLVDSMLRSGRMTSEALDIAREVEKTMLAPESAKSLDARVNAMMLHADVLAAMGERGAAAHKVAGAWSVLGIEEGTDPRIEARVVLLQGEVPQVPSAELAEALKTARARWAE